MQWLEMMDPKFIIMASSGREDSTIFSVFHLLSILVKA